MKVIHLSKEEAVAIVYEAVKNLAPEQEVAMQSHLWQLISEICREFHGVWQQKRRCFSWPC